LVFFQMAMGKANWSRAPAKSRNLRISGSRPDD